MMPNREARSVEVRVKVDPTLKGDLQEIADYYGEDLGVVAREAYRRYVAWWRQQAGMEVDPEMRSSLLNSPEKASEVVGEDPEQESISEEEIDALADKMVEEGLKEHRQRKN